MSDRGWNRCAGCGRFIGLAEFQREHGAVSEYFLVGGYEGPPDEVIEYYCTPCAHPIHLSRLKRRLKEKFHPKPSVKIRAHRKSCATCAYFRIQENQHATTSECILLGQTLGISAKLGGHSRVVGWGRQRLCDEWRERPSKWHITTEKSPHHHDKFLPRPLLLEARKRLPPDRGG